MSTTAKAKRLDAKALETIDEDADVERFLVENHKEVATKLEEARASIARGKAAPLEPLHVLLRDARRNHKATS
jgi:hypothetical protein